MDIHIKRSGLRVCNYKVFSSVYFRQAFFVYNWLFTDAFVSNKNKMAEQIRHNFCADLTWPQGRFLNAPNYKNCLQKFLIFVKFKKSKKCVNSQILKDWTTIANIKKIMKKLWMDELNKFTLNAVKKQLPL